MSYYRVIPRDLFNEGNLLKCYGQLYLNLEKMGLEGCLKHEGGPFLIEQNPWDGSISILNVHLFVRENQILLSRPLNSRDPYPLYADIDEDTTIPVFHDDGSFTEEMTRFLKGTGTEPE